VTRRPWHALASLALIGASCRALAQDAAPAPPPSAASAPAAVSDESAASVDADVAALIAQHGTSDAESAGTAPLRVYGFTDFGLDKYFFKHNGVGLLRPTSATTFVFGNLNLFFDAAPMPHLRTLIEVRLTLAPHGEEIELGPPLGTSYERIDTTTFDFSSPSSQSQLRLGGIFIERAYGEYTFSELFKVRWGMYLNPFGIWNLDHGSPTLIGLLLPTFISAQMIPTRLLGVHAYGSWISGSSELGYSLHVSNGRTPLDFDLTEDKAIGARLYYAKDADFGRVVIGTSGYIGTYVDQQKEINPAQATNFVNDEIYSVKTTVDYAEQVWGADVALDIGQLRVRAEGVLRWVEYSGDKSERIETADGSLQYMPNRLEWSGYVLAAYRTPWYVEPFIHIEASKKSYTLPRWAGDTRATNPEADTVFLSAGMNFQLLPYLLLKTQFVWARANQPAIASRPVDAQTIFVRVVDSF
jgi:hypothetical protein